MENSTGTIIEPNLNSENNDFLAVYADIETDSIQGTCLLQIAAVTQNGEKFNVYINPQRPIPLTITNLLGLHWFKGDLYKNGLRLSSKHIIPALVSFTEWIHNLEKPVMLIFHNGFSFDCSVLARELVHFQIKIPDNLIKVADTLPAFRNNIKAPEIENHKLSTLAQHFNIENKYAHDALADSETLKLICEKFIEHNGGDLMGILINSTRNFTDYLNKYLLGEPIPRLKKRKPNKKEKNEEKDKK